MCATLLHVQFQFDVSRSLGSSAIVRGQAVLQGHEDVPSAT